MRWCVVREAAKHEMGVTQCVAGAPWCTYRYRVEPYRNIDYRKFIEYRILFGTVFGIDTIISKSSIRYTTLVGMVVPSNSPSHFSFFFLISCVQQ